MWMLLLFQSSCYKLAKYISSQNVVCITYKHMTTNIKSTFPDSCGEFPHPQCPALEIVGRMVSPPWPPQNLLLPSSLVTFPKKSHSQQPPAHPTSKSSCSQWLQWALSQSLGFWLGCFCKKNSYNCNREGELKSTQLHSTEFEPERNGRFGEHTFLLSYKEKMHMSRERWGGMTHKSPEKKYSIQDNFRSDGLRRNIKQAILRPLSLLCIITDQLTAARNIYTAPDQASKERKTKRCRS